jgi:hypothetical protein
MEPYAERRFVESWYCGNGRCRKARKKRTAGFAPGGLLCPITGQSAFRGVVDHLVVQCGSAGFIDLHHSARHRLIEVESQSATVTHPQIESPED